MPSQLLYSRFFDRPGRREATCVTKTSLSTLFRYVRVIGAFYPDMIREEIKDSMAERGITEEDIRELIQKLEGAPDTKH